MFLLCTSISVCVCVCVCVLELTQTFTLSLVEAAQRNDKKKGIKTKKTAAVHRDTTRPVIHNAAF